MKKSLHLRFMSAAMLMGFACAASAANQTVTDAAGLKAAIAQAEQGDVITVNGTITVDETIKLDNKIVTLQGGTLDGAGLHLILWAENNTQLTLKDMTLQNANHKDENDQEKGGALRIQGGSLTVEGCKFIDNTVDQTHAVNWNGGGAFWACDCEVNVTDTEFEGNVGFHGGAVSLLHGYGRFDNCTFTDNEATVVDQGKITDEAIKGGGAVFVRWDSADPRTLTFYNCKFYNNKAKRLGGAICFVTGGDNATKDYENNVLTIQNCVFSGNTTLLQNINQCRGGALELYLECAATVNVFASTFYKNYANNKGGAIEIEQVKKDGHIAEVNVVNCTLSGNAITNDGGGNGGGIMNDRRPFNEDGTQATYINIANTIFSGNKGNYDPETGTDKGNSDFRIQADDDVFKSIAMLRNCLIRDLNDVEYTKEGEAKCQIDRLVEFASIEGTKVGNAPNHTSIGITDALLEPTALFGDWTDDSYLPLKADGYAALNPAEDADALAAEFGLYTDQLDQLLNKNLVGAVSLKVGDPIIPSAIDDVVAEEVENTDDSYYTLSGVRISKPSQPGIYIHKGKKIVIR